MMASRARLQLLLWPRTAQKPEVTHCMSKHDKSRAWKTNDNFMNE